MSEKFRNRRSSLCAKVKSAIFEVFENELPPISNVAKSKEITDWKKKPTVSNCYKKLFEIKDDETYMEEIIKTVWPKKKKISNQQVAWAISIAEIFLDPQNEHIKICEEIILPTLEKNEVSYF